MLLASFLLFFWGAIVTVGRRVGGDLLMLERLKEKLNLFSRGFEWVNPVGAER
jgi:hypothetical protein